MTDTGKYWDRVAREWREGHPQQLWRAHSDALYRDLLARWLPAAAPGRLLKTDLFDEAVGEGLYGALAARASTVVGVDLSVETGGRAHRNHPGLLAVGGDARRLPFASDTFDVVFSNSTLDHFDSREEIVESLREIGRVLRPAGTLLITLDNLSNPVVALRQVLPFQLLNRLGLLPYRVGATYRPAGLRRALEQCGFAVDRTGAVLHCPRALVVALARLLEKRGSTRARARFLRFLGGFEQLSAWPTRFATGYYVAARAVKR
ncbi:MAG: class I SAM-dependent methyltransferase [Deferrisomatales bacterium]|nr:class I SAM-dependent methyltransferase [Deferrisomatales bacterium]